MSRSELSVSRWLDAHSDRSAGLTTLPNNVVLADVAGDGDHRLVLADIKLDRDTRSRLKVYKGTLLTNDQAVLNIPSAVISFYADDLESKVPAIGIACGLELLVYKNNKPFHKCTVPSLSITQVERDAWTKFSKAECDITKVIDDLKATPLGSLSSRTQKLLTLKPEEQMEYISRFKDMDLKRLSPITCATTIPRTPNEPKCISCPIVATECGQVYFLDPQSYGVIHQASTSSLKSTPCIIKSSGLYDIEFRIFIATREGYVCLLRRNWLEGKILLQTSSYIVDMAVIPGDSLIMLATSNNILSCYTKKGNKMWNLEMKQPITCLCLIPLKHLSTCLLGVGLKGGSIQVYQGRHPVDYISLPDTPSAIIFGQMGQEEHVLIIITMSGMLDIKILKRTADFNLSTHDQLANPIVQSKPLPLPKRSKLFLEQSARERQNAIEMHQHFQQDLIRLRLNAARTLVQTQNDQFGTGNEKEMVKLSAQVLGLGPKFTLILNLENISNDKPLTNFSLVFHCRPSVYKLSTYYIQIPLVPPSLIYKVETRIEDVAASNSDPSSGIVDAEKQHIKVFCVKRGQAQPVLAATINMPLTDMTLPYL